MSLQPEGDCGAGTKRLEVTSPVFGRTASRQALQLRPFLERDQVMAAMIPSVWPQVSCGSLISSSGQFRLRTEKRPGETGDKNLLLPAKLDLVGKVDRQVAETGALTSEGSSKVSVAEAVTQGSLPLHTSTWQRDLGNGAVETTHVCSLHEYKRRGRRGLG